MAHAECEEPSLLAMVVNDDAGCLDARGVATFFASKLAPTGNASPPSKRTACIQLGTFIVFPNIHCTKFSQHLQDNSRALP
jgi:hypothetical protein